MDTRILEPEQMDDPGLDPAAHRRALDGLRRLNRATGGASSVWRPIRRVAREHGVSHLRVLDVATGGGDVALGLWRRAKRAGLDLALDACDVSRVALGVAAARAERVNASVRWVRCDVSTDFPEGPYDVIVTSLFMHHLPDGQIVDLLARMRDHATMAVVVNDLARSRANLWQVRLASRVLTRSPVVHFDAVQSVRAAHTPREFASLARDAGFRAFTVKRCWPCRFQLVKRTAGGIRG